MVKSVVTIRRILDCFSEERPVLTGSDLAQHLEMNKSTLHHVLKTMVDCGLLDRTSNRQYMLGLRLLEYGLRVRHRLRVEEVAMPVLERLRDLVQETVHLAIIDGLDALYIKKIDGRWSMRMASHEGYRTPLYASAVGKIFLAYHPELIGPVVEHGFHAFTPHTMVDPVRLEADLKRVCDQQYAINREEAELGLIAVAGPVFDASHTVMAAISVAGPSNRIEALGISWLGQVVLTACADVSRAMGSKWPLPAQPLSMERP